MAYEVKQFLKTFQCIRFVFILKMGCSDNIKRSINVYY